MTNIELARKCYEAWRTSVEQLLQVTENKWDDLHHRVQECWQEAAIVAYAAGAVAAEAEERKRCLEFVRRYCKQAGWQSAENALIARIEGGDKP